MAIRQQLIEAVDLALAGQWEAAHAIVQKHDGNADAAWLHACLHKIEGDADNSRYWYRQSTHSYEEYADPKAELVTIKAAMGY